MLASSISVRGGAVPLGDFSCVFRKGLEFYLIKGIACICVTICKDIGNPCCIVYNKAIWDIFRPAGSELFSRKISTSIRVAVEPVTIWPPLNDIGEVEQVSKAGLLILTPCTVSIFINVLEGGGEVVVSGKFHANRDCDASISIDASSTGCEIFTKPVVYPSNGALLLAVIVLLVQGVRS